MFFLYNAEYVLTGFVPDVPVRVGHRVPLQARQFQGARCSHRNRSVLVRIAAHSRKHPLQAAHQKPRRAGNVSVQFVGGGR